MSGNRLYCVCSELLIHQSFRKSKKNKRQMNRWRHFSTTDHIVAFSKACLLRSADRSTPGQGLWTLLSIAHRCQSRAASLALQSFLLGQAKLLVRTYVRTLAFES